MAGPTKPALTALRPPLESQDTLDEERLTGTLGRDGVASLHTNTNGSANGTWRPKHVSMASTPENWGAAAESNGAGVNGGDVPEDVIEDYDDLELDPDTLVVNGRKSLDESLRPAIGEMEEWAAKRRAESSSGDSKLATAHRKRGSIQIRLERTDRKGHYILTADDPDIREILQKSLEREALSANDKKPRLRFRDLVFTRQFTRFDRQNPTSQESPFFGFFTLFWIAMALLLFQVSMRNFREHGSILGRNQIGKMMFSHDVYVLGLTDGVMCAATLVTFFLQKLVQWQILNWGRGAWILQNIWQSVYLASLVGWAYFREWPWSHTIFAVLHGLVFLMKQHSFAFYNGYLSGVYRRRNLLQKKLEQLQAMEPIQSPPTSPGEKRKSEVFASGIDLSEFSTASDAKRRPSMANRTTTNFAGEQSAVAAIASAIQAGSAISPEQMQIFERVISAEIDDLTRELCGKNTSGSNAYPKNLRILNFAEFIVLPTLVYELEYPRQEKINWWYVLEKLAATFGVLCIMMVISQAYIYPPVAKTIRMKAAGMTVQERWQEFPWIVSEMLFPLLIEQLLTWYLIWECILNVLAELTYFADRGFYGDWWNSVTWDQYARDWNRPVHNFLLRHVYHSSISTFHLSRNAATFVTFLLSALVHEMCMALMFRKVRGYLLATQLLQMPLVMLSRSSLLKDRVVLGNVIFWVGLFIGPSFLTSLYLVL